MRRLILCNLLFFYFHLIHAQDLPYELQHPEVVSVNRLPMRASFFAYETKEAAEQGVKENSLNYLSLNGLWKFHWVQDPRKRPTDFFRTDFDDTGWNNFPVPANWELNGFGLPIYVNTVYEFTGHAKKGAALNPPFDIPVDNNPVGSYRKKIIIPESWEGRQIFIHLGAVKSAFFIWVNGVKVGYSEDSKLAAEFDITSYVKTGENIVALQVYRWSDASYLECQDMWRISGIERDIYLYSTPRLSVGDFKVKALLDETYTNGVLDLNVRIENYKIDKQTFHSTPDKFSVRYELYDPLGNLQLTGSETAKVLGNFRADLKFQAKIANVYKWSAETPWLYKLYLTLMDSSGTVLEVIPHNIGFRSVEIKGNQFLINGKPVLLKGVNRHEHDPRTGHVISRELMLKDMEMMKKLNINAVRHSHYPPDPYWLELCDKYGLYVVEEANIESHGMGYDLDVSLGNNKKWRVPHLDRIQRMYERSKNFTSVVTWSLGNEGGNGVNFYEGYEWLKQNDYRPVQYERAEMDYNTDIIVPQYPDPDWLIKYALSNPQRPLIMSEYAHIMGNSLGNFREYWDAIEKYPSLQGGFIWEWVDQSIDTIRNGKRILAYGGDFPLEGPVDENISDNNFCVKGVVTAERKLTPMAVEIKHVHQYIKTRLTSQNTISVFNDQFFKPVNNVRLNWHLIENGKVVQKGFNTDIRIAPRDSLSVLLPINFNQKPGREYFLNVRWTLISDEPLVESGYEVAYDQFALSELPVVIWPSKRRNTVRSDSSETSYFFYGKDFTITFDKNEGILTSYELNKKRLIQNGPQPSFWRAPVDNDFGAGFNSSLRMWRDAYAKGKTVRAQVTLSASGNYILSFRKELLNGDAAIEQDFEIFPGGDIKISNRFYALKGECPLLLRIGNDLELAKELRNIEWYGRGPWENYFDRKSASLVGIYKSDVQHMYFPYARPQESGNRSDTRWVQFVDEKGKGIRFEYADSLLNFSALPYSLDDLDPEMHKKQYHSGELEQRPKIYVHIDLNQTGVQGIQSWGAWPMEKYRLIYQNYSYSYWIKRIN